MSTDHKIIASASFIVIHGLLKNRKKRKRRWWVTPLFQNRRKHLYSELYKGVVLGNSEYIGIEHFCKMSSSDFEKLIQLLGPMISKEDTYYREAIPVKDRLSVTLRFLASGESYTSLSYLFRISKQTISTAVPEICRAIIYTFKHDMKMPTSVEEWLSVSREFSELWNFPHCLGVIDGKYIVLQAPVDNSRIILFAVVDADYKFIYVSATCQANISDWDVFRNTSFYRKLQRGNLQLPQENALPNRHKYVPYVYVADDTFPLQETIMKPFPGRHVKGSVSRCFNYRLLRTHQVIDNAFGIVASVFRVLRKPMLLQPKNAILVTLACLNLHNFLRNSKSSRNMYTPVGTFDQEHGGQIIEGNWRKDGYELTSLFPLQKNFGKYTQSAQEIRQEFGEYFASDCLPWQDDSE